jgi:uncharacterized protein with GYD domain
MALPLYMAQFAYISEAWAAFMQHSEDRTPVIEDLAERLGCRFQAFYYSLGEYDGFVILDAPNETAVTAFILASMAPGHVRATKTDCTHERWSYVRCNEESKSYEYHGPRE